MSKTLYIIRGCSGSGKSSFAKTLAAALNCQTIEADDFMYENGIYEWRADKLASAHYATYRFIKSRMQEGAENVIVSDTNVKLKDLNVYLELAEEFHYRVVSLVVENRHGNQSIHDVSEKTMARQEAALRNSLKLRP